MAKVLKLTRNQTQAFMLCAEWHMTDTARVVHRIQRRTLERLAEHGLVKWRPYAKQPHWALTPMGRKVYIDFATKPFSDVREFK